MESDPSSSFFRLHFEHIDSYGYLIMIFTIMVTMIYFMQKKVRGYLRNRDKLKGMAEEYERKRECRNELKFHYFWALESGERKKAMQIGQEIIEMDKELKDLYSQYQFYKEKGYYPLKKI